MTVLVKRKEEIVRLFRTGKTQSEIGKSFDITRQRVQQILDSAGLNQFDGGKRLRDLAAKAEKMKARNDKFEKRYGMSREEYLSIPALARKAFLEQRRNMCSQGHVWILSLGEWWDIWQSSGKWKQRGMGARKYCLARVACVGPFSADNVHVCQIGRVVRDQRRWNFSQCQHSRTRV